MPLHLDRCIAPLCLVENVRAARIGSCHKHTIFRVECQADGSGLTYYQADRAVALADETPVRT